jgi:hypothetical protein
MAKIPIVINKINFLSTDHLCIYAIKDFGGAISSFSDSLIWAVVPGKQTRVISFLVPSN